MPLQRRAIAVGAAGVALAAAVAGTAIAAPAGAKTTVAVAAVSLAAVSATAVAAAGDTTSPAEKKRVDSAPTPKLGWYTCYGTAECATVRLPLDYDQPA